MIFETFDCRPVITSLSANIRPGKGLPIDLPAGSSKEPIPANREALLEAVGYYKREIYVLVRQILDDMEAAAPWERLYYPPADIKEFLAMEIAFLKVIDGIPARVRELTDVLEQDGLDVMTRQVLGDAEFFFEGIHSNVSHDITKLRSKIKALGFTVDSIALTPEERAFTCEVTADLKGKYSSSIMGAAASLVAEGLWQGVEIEPMLFPEKEDEFERNELLVEVLSEVVENITNLVDEVPLAEFVAQWEKEQRIDQYALTSLYSFLGNVGKLMQGKCRRALYSGDYHQIQKRENLLTARINELTTLHNMTWGTAPPGMIDESQSPFPLLILKATELAAILDINILKKIVGEKVVKDVYFIITLEKEKASANRVPGNNLQDTPTPQNTTLRQSLPEHLHSLVPLLADEDLQTFLNLLLGSVLKRASLALRRKKPETESRAAESPSGTAAKDDMPVFDFESVQTEEPSVEFAAEQDLGPGEIEFAPAQDPGPEEVEFPALDMPLEPPEMGIPWLEEDIPEVDYSAIEMLDQGRGDKPSAEKLLQETEESAPAPSPVMSEASPPTVPASALGSPGNFALTSDDGGELLAPPDADLESIEERHEALQNLLEILNSLLSRTNPHRKSFELVFRLLKQKKNVPPSMLESMHPYLYDVMNNLMPALYELTDVEEISASHSANLIEYCKMLCDKDVTPEELRDLVPETMERVLRLLDGMRSTTTSLIDEILPTTFG